MSITGTAVIVQYTGLDVLSFGHSPGQFSQISLHMSVINLQIHPYRGCDAFEQFSQALFCLSRHLLAVFLCVVCFNHIQSTIFKYACDYPWIPQLVWLCIVNHLCSSWQQVDGSLCLVLVGWLYCLSLCYGICILCTLMCTWTCPK